MNEFEYLRQMRSLKQPVAPTRDLWAGIERGLDQAERAATPERAARRPMRWLAVAAIATLAVISGGLGLRLATMPGTAPAPMAAAPAWKPDDPRLSGAALELDSARMELSQAMQQSPGTEALQRLLIRTERQQDRLRHLEQQAG
jgi:anti-sigma-K factor RskA